MRWIAGTLFVSADVDSVHTNTFAAPLRGAAQPLQVLQACVTHLSMYDAFPEPEDSEQAFVLKTLCR
jgi:hypothetical protein